MKSYKNILLSSEFLILFFGVPLFIFLDDKLVHPSILIIPVLIIIFIILRFRTDFKFKELIYFRISRKILIDNALIVLISGLFLFFCVLFCDREQLFNLPRANIRVWLAMCFFYPVISAFGQEIIYRTFIFKRYRALFRNDKWLILASAVSFSFVHIVYYSQVSLILTFIAGLYFARMYSLTKSVLLTTILHGSLGLIVFTVGFGQYFWLDMYRWM